MSLGLATSGYLSDEYLSDLPITPVGGAAHFDAKPVAPKGVASLEDPPPAPPSGGSGVQV